MRTGKPLIINEVLTLPNLTTKTFEQALATQTVAVINAANNINSALTSALGVYVQSVVVNNTGKLTTTITRTWMSSVSRTAFNLANTNDLATLDAARNAYNTENGITYTETIVS